MIRNVNGVKSGFLAVSIALTVLLLSSYYSAVKAESRANITSSPSQKDAVLVIRFNQKYVYFENALKKVIDKVYGIKPNAGYEIQSVIPNDGNDGNAKKYLENLRNVVAEFNRLGIPKERISIRTDVTDLVQSQEINIFVR
ncbi:MAG: hypothetical protein AABY33_00645 [Pseudomonadota bacterium]